MIHYPILDCLVLLLRGVMEDLVLGGLLKAESVSCRIEQPGIVIGTLHTGVQSEGLSWQFSSGQWTRIG